jgi:hypothetical protein
MFKGHRFFSILSDPVFLMIKAVSAVHQKLIKGSWPQFEERKVSDSSEIQELISLTDTDACIMAEA